MLSIILPPCELRASGGHEIGEGGVVERAIRVGGGRPSGVHESQDPKATHRFIAPHLTVVVPKVLVHIKRVPIGITGPRARPARLCELVAGSKQPMRSPSVSAFVSKRRPCHPRS